MLRRSEAANEAQSSGVTRSRCDSVLRHSRHRPLAQGAVADKWRWLTFLVFGVIIAITMFVTFLAAKRVKSAADFYTAGGGVSGLQNGWAIAGDYLSAASFLGIAGLISLYGYDGFMYSVGWLVAYITVLLVIAEPCRNIGKYTLADILAYRNNPTRDADRRRAFGHHRVDVLPDGADGRRWRAGEDADRHRLRDLGDRRRRADARLRAVRRHGRDDMGADHQGGSARDRVDHPGDVRVGAVRLQPAGVPARRRRRRQGAGDTSPRCSATRRER